MSEPLHPAASAPLPWFITAPGETDILMVVMALILIVFSVGTGVLYFRLHALPDRFAHQKIQLEIVCVLGLIAMFTHMHIFWIAGLLLAMIDLPDFGTPLRRIAGATEKIVDSKSLVSVMNLSVGVDRSRRPANIRIESQTASFPSENGPGALGSVPPL